MLENVEEYSKYQDSDDKQLVLLQCFSQCMDHLKKSSLATNHRSSFNSRTSSSSQRVLTNTCKLYLSKYEEIKRQIDSKAKQLEEMKVKKLKLDQKTRRESVNDKCNNYKIEMVSNKQNIEQYLNIYKQQYEGELTLLEHQQKLQIKLRQLLLEEEQLKVRLKQIKRQIKTSKQNSKFNFESTKYEEEVKEVRFKLIEKEIEINNVCSSKRLKNLRYYICQFGKEYGLSVLSDLMICEQRKVNVLQEYLKSQPIFLTLKRQIQDLSNILEKRPNLPQLLQALKQQQQLIQNQLKSIQGSIVSTNAEIQRNQQDIEQENNKQLKLNLKTLLEQNIDNPANLRKEAQFIALEQRKRVTSVKQKLHEITKISHRLKNIKQVENSRKELVNKRDSLQKIITVEQNKLKDKLIKKTEIQTCLDNIISDGYAFNEEIKKSKRVTIANLEEQINKPSDTFRPRQDELRRNPSARQLRCGLGSQSTTAFPSYTSRQSRLVSLSQTEKRLPITHSMNKKSVEDIIMSRITRRSNK